MQGNIQTAIQQETGDAIAVVFHTCRCGEDG